MSNYDSIEKQASYGIGRQMGQQLEQQSFEGLCADSVAQGVKDHLNGDTSPLNVDQINTAFAEINERLRVEQEARAKVASGEGEKFLEENAKRAEIQVTASGLQYEVITEGSGAKPSHENTVRTHYEGKLVDGKIFDSSYRRGQPAEFPVGGVIAGWTEALKLMPVGSKWRLYIPQNLAYGERGAGNDIPPYSALIFEIELLDIVS